MDKFRVETIVATPNPQQVVWAAMHQDYSEEFVWDKRDRFPEESKAGELIVKHLLAGNRGHYGCYSSDTEVLTKQGWIAWEKVTENHKLLAVDIETKTAHFEKPSSIQKIKFREEDKLYSVKSPYLDLLVTLDHRMVVSHRQKSGEFSEWYFKNASEIYNKPVRYLLTSFLSPEARKIPEDIPQDLDISTIFKVAGFFFGDGLRTHNKNPASIRFRLRNPRKIAYLLSLDLPTLEMKGDRYVIKNKSLAAWVHENFSTDNGKCIPQWMLTLPENAILAFWDGLKNSDGTRVTKKSWGFNSCEKSAIDLIQATAHINGFSANLTLNNPNVGQKHLNHKPCWRLNISERETQLSQEERNPGIFESLSDYSGYVYCASVSTGALLVRRNRKVIVCGNCLEHPQITFNVGYFPHSMMQQVRTHRVGVSFDVQCLAEDTEITFVKADSRLKKIQIAELYDLWINGQKIVPQRKTLGTTEKLTESHRRDCKKRLQKMRLRVLNENTGEFETSHIKDVVCSGIQPVYRLTLEDGKTLKCTTNHKLLTSKGWQRMGEAVGLVTALDNSVIGIQKDCFVLCNGLAVAGNGLYRNRQWLQEQIQQGKTAEEIAQLSKCSDTTVRDWVRKYELKFNQILNPVNWTPKPKPPGRKLKAHPVKVTKVEYLGLQVTYDLEVVDPWHNFIANGIVVHNSFRYTGSRIIEVIEAKRDIEDVFYLRPVGNYTNRQGKHYFYSEEQRQQDLQWCLEACKIYQQRISEGLAEEQARSLIPFDARQHFVMSCNARSLMHLLDLRWKKDAQLEAQKFCELLYERFEEWMPNVAHWYLENRAKKARLSP